MARSNRRSRRRSRNQRGGFLGIANPFAGMFGKKEEEKPLALAPAPTESTGGDHYPGHPSSVHMGGRRRRRRRTKRRKSRRGRKSRKRRRKSRKSKRRRKR